MDDWRSKALSEAEIKRNSLCYHASGLMASHPLIEAVILPVSSLQAEHAKKLLDLTWTEALQALIEDLRRDLDEARKLSREFGENDAELAWATSEILRVLRRARKVHQDWLAEGRSDLSGTILGSYRAKVGGYYSDDPDMRRRTTEQARQQAKRLQREKLDNDPYVVELRTKLHVPDDGFQDVDRAAYWLYDRYPPNEGLDPYGPEDFKWIYGDRRPNLYDPAIMKVPVLAEATSRLRKKHKLDPNWDFLLCFYLLRGKLDPLPRKRRRRRRPKAYRDAYLLYLLQRHSRRHTQIIYNWGLLEEEFLGIV